MADVALYFGVNYRHPMPVTSIDFTSQNGKQLFREALEAGYMDNYFSLASQFRTQGERTFCGTSTLLMVLNTLEIEPWEMWKDSQRWHYEKMLTCCVSLDTVRKCGITLKELVCIAQCNALHVNLVQATVSALVEDFRSTVKDICGNQTNKVLVVGYDRVVLQQQGVGHYSPIAGYHPEEDLVLILDTARFKYKPHWVKLELLYQAMTSKDSETGEARGYMVLSKRLEEPSSSYFIINNTAQILSRTSLKSVQAWRNWLTEPSHTTIDISRKSSTEFLTQAVRMMRDVASEADNSDIQLSIVVRQHSCSLHQCVIQQILSSVSATKLYQLTGANVTSCRSSRDDIADPLQYLTHHHYVAFLLLAWPYRHLEGTNSMRMKEYVQTVLLQSDFVFQEEVTLLKRQLESYIYRVNNLKFHSGNKLGSISL